VSNLAELPQVYPVEIDWPRCLTELRRFGWTPYKVALTLCIDPPTVYAWEKAKSKPGHARGAALLVLHRHVCGTQYSEKLYMDCAKGT
jgi:hypothetical protein